MFVKINQILSKIFSSLKNIKFPAEYFFSREFEFQKITVEKLNNKNVGFKLKRL